MGASHRPDPLETEQITFRRIVVQRAGSETRGAEMHRLLTQGEGKVGWHLRSCMALLSAQMATGVLAVDLESLFSSKPGGNGGAKAMMCGPPSVCSTRARGGNLLQMEGTDQLWGEVAKADGTEASTVFCSAPPRHGDLMHLAVFRLFTKVKEDIGGGWLRDSSSCVKP